MKKITKIEIIGIIFLLIITSANASFSNYNPEGDFDPEDSFIIMPKQKTFSVDTGTFWWGLEGENYNVYFKNISSWLTPGSNIMAMERAGYVIMYTPAGSNARYPTYFPTKAAPERVAKKAGTSTIQPSGNTVVYPSQCQQYGNNNHFADLTYSYYPDHLKENIIISEKDWLQTRFNILCDDDQYDDVVLNFSTSVRCFKINNGFSMGVKLNYIPFGNFGSWQDNGAITSGVINFTDEAEDTVFYIPELYAYDSIGNNILINKSISIRGGVLNIVTSTPYNWLNSSELVYPVYIDPTLYAPQYFLQEDHNITITNPIPANGTSGVWPYTEYGSQYSTSNLYFTLNHTYGKTMNWTVWSNATGTWTWVDFETIVDNGTYYAVMDADDGMTEFNTTYYWSVNVTNYSDGDIDNQWQNITYSFTTGNQSHLVITNLTDAVGPHMTWAGTEQSSDVWCNNSGINEETMVINVTINDTAPDGYINSINIWMGDLWCNGDLKEYWINSSNFTIYVSGNQTGPYFEIGHDLGKGNGTFLDSENWYDGTNITINSATWGAIPNNPWVVYGDGAGNITQTCKIYVRVKIDVPYFTPIEIADINNQTYFYASGWRVWANMTEDSKVLMYREFSGMFYYAQEWLYKSGFDNSTYGPPDFDQKQNDEEWKQLPGIGTTWTHCGPVALLDCMWWLDCKYNNVTKDYSLPDFAGYGSKSPQNVIPTVDWVADYLNTSTPIIPDVASGTSATNMTLGILNLLNTTNVSNILELTVEGYQIGDVWNDESVNYTNVTSQVANGSDVILLLGFWCEYMPSMWARIGGHFVQVDGYNSQTPGLLIADPYKDNAGDGGAGWVSTPADQHDHDLYGNGSHNWTQNVSYDYYDVTFPMFGPPGGWFALDNYTEGMGNVSANWTGSNWLEGSYQCTGSDCWDCMAVEAIVEVAWYINEADNCNITASKTIWNGSAWIGWDENLTVGETFTTNMSVINNGATVKSLVVSDTYYDAWNYTAGTSTIYFSDGTSYAREPNASIPCSDESCEEARHGFLYWYINYSDEGMPLLPGESLWIISEWTVFNSHYSSNGLVVDACLVNESCMDWMYVNCSDDDNVYINQKFNASINCEDCATSEETSDWNVSEHIHRDCTEGECYDEGWEEYETDFDKWYSVDTMTTDWGWVYMYKDPNGDGADSLGLSYTIANDSCVNRSMSTVKMRYTYDWMGIGDYEIPTAGLIYAFTDNNNHDMILYGFNTTYLLSKVAGTLVNTIDATPVQYPYEAINYYGDWWCNDTASTGDMIPESGLWIKTLYSDFTDLIQTKAWNVTDGTCATDICNEPSGWIAHETQPNNSFVVSNFPINNCTDDFINIYRNHPSAIDQSAVGQTFTTPPGKTYYLDRVGFYLRSWMGLNGNLTANLYEVTTCGGGGKSPSGGALATSELVDCLSLGGGPGERGLYTSFPFDDPQYLMEADHEYAISLELQDSTNADGVIYVDVADVENDTYNGNEFDYFATVWECWETWDMAFNLIGRNNTITDKAEAFGLVIWNPERQNTTGDLSFDAQFDWIDMWKLNYSRDEQANATQEAAHYVYGSDGIPLMEFPQFTDLNWETQYLDWYYDVFVAWVDGNITNQTYGDNTYCYYRNISNLYSMESRPFYPELDCGAPYKQNDQNDSLYYYAGVVTNVTEPFNFKNALIFEIQDATDGTEDIWDGAIVGIDVDNNMQWDDNDMMFIWYNNTMGTNFTIWKGDTLWGNGTDRTMSLDALFEVDMASCTFGWKDNYLYNVDFSLPALHRYSEHRVYFAMIPTYYFIKSNGEMLNADDTFGLYVQTIDADWANGWLAPDGAPIWNNWNETEDSYYTLGEVAANDIYNNFNDYLNLSSNYEIIAFREGSFWNGTDTDEIINWAHGRILNITGYMTENWELYIQKTANVSSLPNITVDNFVNYTITICNNGTLNTTNVKVNDTLAPGIWYINSSVPYANVTGSDRNWTFNITSWFNGTGCITINITVNFTAGCAMNGSTVINFARVYADEPVSDTDTVGITYGSNTAPTIVWQYPTDATTVSLLLTNMTVVVEDAEADNMDIYIFTNKSGWGNSVDTWTPIWNSIGSNSTVTNGTYVGNQTFNNTNLFNTRWRWGGTTYYWYVNVTDGKTWTNETFTFTTAGSRYDVTTSGDVVFGDAIRCWDYRAGSAPYRGIYDVDASGDVTFSDAIDTWDNRT